MPELTNYFREALWIFVATLTSFVLFLWLFVKGSNYSVEDTEAHSEEYAGMIKEGHGGMTPFLWVSFALLFTWTIYYFIIKAQQFLVIFAVASGQ